MRRMRTQLDPGQFAQVHRSVAVNLRSISHVTRGDNETATIHLKNRADSQFLHFTAEDAVVGCVQQMEGRVDHGHDLRYAF